MTEPIDFEKEMLRAANPKEFTSGLAFIGRVFVDQCWPNLEQALKHRLQIMNDSDFSLAGYTRQTYLCIVLFFSYVDGTAISTKRLLKNAGKYDFLEKLSKKQRALLSKSDKRINFEELMKVQFSILPHAIGAPVEYGTIKQESFGLLFRLRAIRNKIVHPMGLEELMSINLDDLQGNDINQPMADFMGQLNNNLIRSMRRLIPAESRDSIDFRSLFRARQFNIDG